MIKPGNIFHNRQMHPGFRLIVAVAGALLIVGTLFWLLAPSQPATISNLDDSRVLKENRNGPVIGHLGGVPVTRTSWNGAKGRHPNALTSPASRASASKSAIRTWPR